MNYFAKLGIRWNNATAAKLSLKLEAIRYFSQ